MHPITSETDTRRFNQQSLIIIIALLCIIGVWAAGELISRKVVDTQKAWKDYNEQATEITQHLSRLQEAVGYGGFIHTYKNWVLRRDPKYAEKLSSEIQEIQQVLESYRSIPSLTDAELEALNSVERVFAEYSDKYYLSLQPDYQSLPTRELDPLVKVDDQPALDAIARLREASTIRAMAQETSTRNSMTEVLRYVSFRFILLPLVLIAAGLLILYLRRLVHANAAMTAAEDKVNTIIDVAPQPLMIIGSDGTVQRANKQASLLFGSDNKSLIGVSVESLMPEKYRRAHVGQRHDYIANTGAKEDAAMRREMLVRRTDGTHLPVETSLAYMHSDKEPLIIATFYDLSERKAVEQAMIEAKAAAEAATESKSNFLAIMSHEIRTPMNAIIGMSYLALRTSLAPKQRNYIEKAHYSAESLLGILNDILDFSKIESGKLELEENDFRLEDVMDNITNLIGLKAEEKGVTLNFKVAPAVPCALIGDCLRLGQILINLSSNAVKFTPAGGEVLIGAEVKENSDDTTLIHFLVQETGLGLTPEQQSRLFQSFTQADSSTTREYGGTGLGLAISKNLTTMMGGKIWVESNIHEGSTFHFTVRLKRQLGAPSQRRSTISKPQEVSDVTIAKLKGAKILLVEDNEFNQELAIELLRSNDISVELAVNGQEAIERLEEETFDGVLMDCLMPVMDGYIATRKLREQERFKALPIIAMTANTMTGDKEKALQAGMNDHIPKPVCVNEMFAIMAKWITPNASITDKTSDKTKMTTLTETNSEEPLPQLPGINTAKGLELAASDARFYRRMLGKFKGYLLDFKSQLDAAQQQGDQDAVMRVAHGLKAAAGSMGATGVQTSAEALEMACRAGKDAEETEALLEKMVSEMQPVIKGLDILDGPP